MFKDTMDPLISVDDFGSEEESKRVDTRAHPFSFSVEGGLLSLPADRSHPSPASEKHPAKAIRRGLDRRSSEITESLFYPKKEGRDEKALMKS